MKGGERDLRTLFSFFFSFLKRFASLSRFVETLVVADDKMAAFHGTGLKRYLLTVMAAAAKAFKHPSIRNPVNLVVTRLVILGSGQEGPQVGPSAAQTLRSFCTWQRGLNTPEDSHPDHFDTAILFTRQVRLQSAPHARDHNIGTTAPQTSMEKRPLELHMSLAPATQPWGAYVGPADHAGYPASRSSLIWISAPKHLLCSFSTGPVWSLHM